MLMLYISVFSFKLNWIIDNLVIWVISNLLSFEEYAISRVACKKYKILESKI